MPSHLQVFLLPVKSNRMTSDKHSLAASKVTSFETNFFRTEGMSETETSKMHFPGAKLVSIVKIVTKSYIK